MSLLLGRSRVEYWHDGSNGAVPGNAVIGGYDGTEHLYVGRAEHNDQILIGKIQPSHRVCYISYGGQEIGKKNYQVYSHYHKKVAIFNPINI